MPRVDVKVKKVYKPLVVRIAPVLAKAITKKRVESGEPVTFKRLK